MRQMAHHGGILTHINIYSEGTKAWYLHPVPYILVTSNLSMTSNFRSGFRDFGSLPSRSRCLRSRSRRRLSCRFFSSSGSSGLRSTIEDSEFRRIRRPSGFRDEDDSAGSANISSSPDGRDLLEDDPVAAFRARIASSCDREGRWPGGPRGGTFSPRVTAVYGGGILSPVFDRGGGGRMPLLLGGGLSLRVRLSCSATVSKEYCFNIASYS
jgi:hypothetical protein